MPHKRIYWAGTEMATRWNGYFDGAIQAGEAAARAIDSLLAEPEPTEEPACEPAEEPTETLITSCASDEACGQGAWCNAGVCEPGCNSHTHCGECELCDIVAHQCCFFAGNLCGAASTCPND